MPTPRRNTRRPHPRSKAVKKDRDTLFDEALTRDPTIPQDFRDLYVEHAQTEWTEERYREWCAVMYAGWQRKQADPTWQKLRAEVLDALQVAKALSAINTWDADNLLLYDGKDVRDKLIESLTDALSDFRQRSESEEEMRRLREYAESEEKDATNRMRFDPERFKRQAAEAQEGIKTLGDSVKHLLPVNKRMDDLTVDLHAICREVTHPRGSGEVDTISETTIYDAMLEPILKAFAPLDSAIPSRTRNREPQAAPGQRLKRTLKARADASARAADIWRDGREAEDRAALIARSRYQLFAWDPRFRRQALST